VQATRPRTRMRMIRQFRDTGHDIRKKQLS